jgi:hypothetical protein
VVGVGAAIRPAADSTPPATRHSPGPPPPPPPPPPPGGRPPPPPPPPPPQLRDRSDQTRRCFGTGVGYGSPSFAIRSR